MLEYYIKTTGPKSHIQVCEVISMMGIEILEDAFGEPGKDSFYGIFLVNSDSQSFEILSEFRDIFLEFPKDRTIR